MQQENLSLPLIGINSYRRNNPSMAKYTEKNENKVGPIIERRLRELAKSQQWLAEQVGLSPVSIHNWIKRGSIDRKHIGPAAIALGLTTAQLLGDDQQSQETTMVEPEKMSLQWLPPDEVELLEDYRMSTKEGKEMARSFLKVAPKKESDGEPSGRRYAA